MLCGNCKNSSDHCVITVLANSNGSTFFLHKGLVQEPKLSDEMSDVVLQDSDKDNDLKLLLPFPMDGL